MPLSKDEIEDWLDPIRGDETVGRIAFLPDDFQDNRLTIQALQTDHIRDGLSIQRVDCSVLDEVIEVSKRLGSSKSPNSLAILICGKALDARNILIGALSIKADPAIKNRGHAIIQPKEDLKKSQLKAIRYHLIEFFQITVDINSLS